MKGSTQIISLLNKLLAEELTAINQYIVHAEMHKNWGYHLLHKKTEKRAMDEMRHAESLIERILFLDGRPVISKLNEIHIGENITTQLGNDHEAELEAVKSYQAAITETYDQGDHGTRELLEDILKDEEEHVDWIEAQLDQITHMGLSDYLSSQTKENNS